MLNIDRQNQSYIRDRISIIILYYYRKVNTTCDIPTDAVLLILYAQHFPLDSGRKDL